MCSEAKVMAVKGIDMYACATSMIPESPLAIVGAGMVITPVWQVFLRWIPLYAVLMVAGTLLALETIEAYRVVRNHMLVNHVRPLLDRIYMHQRPKLPVVKDYTKQTIKMSTPHKVYAVSIVLTENQRYSGRYGWKPPTEPHDPAAWTNATDGKVLPKTLFELPDPVIRDMRPDEGGSPGAKVCFYWKWEASEWSCIYTSLTDDSGWSYGSSQWDHFCSSSSYMLGLKTAPTRRRSWKRLASLQKVIVF
ncbi:hypothetical protein DSO57_1014770 [Entomophthora muscae]|nr:hypothetical protein DSO57_1014770 [Entomophthora muscae]